MSEDNHKRIQILNNLHVQYPLANSREIHVSRFAQFIGHEVIMNFEEAFVKVLEQSSHQYPIDAITMQKLYFRIFM